MDYTYELKLRKLNEIAELIKSYKEKGKYKTSDIVNNFIYNVITSDGIHNITLPHRDIKIIEK